MTEDLQRISDFLDAKSAEAGAAKNTISAYARDLREFCDWAAKNNHTLLQLKQAQIESYLTLLHQTGLASATRARRLSAGTVRPAGPAAKYGDSCPDDPARRRPRGVQRRL